jgi:hypothetical protein
MLNRSQTGFAYRIVMIPVAGGKCREHVEFSIRQALACALLAVVLGVSGCASWQKSGINYPVRIDWNDTRWCVPLRLKIVLKDVSRRFGKVRVHSSHRWPFENMRKGGKPRSYHLTCRAVDFSVPGDPAAVKRYLISRPEVGGYSYYRQGFFHIDTGARRTW